MVQLLHRKKRMGIWYSTRRGRLREMRESRPNLGLGKFVREGGLLTHSKSSREGLLHFRKLPMPTKIGSYACQNPPITAWSNFV